MIPYEHFRMRRHVVYNRHASSVCQLHIFADSGRKNLSLSAAEDARDFVSLRPPSIYYYYKETYYYIPFYFPPKIYHTRARSIIFPDRLSFVISRDIWAGSNARPNVWEILLTQLVHIGVAHFPRPVLHRKIYVLCANFSNFHIVNPAKDSALDVWCLKRLTYS